MDFYLQLNRKQYGMERRLALNITAFAAVTMWDVSSQAEFTNPNILVSLVIIMTSIGSAGFMLQKNLITTKEKNLVDNKLKAPSPWPHWKSSGTTSPK